MVRGVIFDLGGTLVNFRISAMDWRTMEERGMTALLRFLAGRGHALPERKLVELMWDALDHGWEEATAGRANLRLLQIIAATVAYFGISLDDDVLMQAGRAYAEGVGEDAAPIDDAHETLRAIKARGLRLGLLSNTMWPGQFHLEHLAECGLLDFFDVTMFSSDTGLWKPNAPAFHYVTERLGVSPAEAVFVGDMLQADVAGSQQAGLGAVWMATDGIELGDVRPDAVIHRLAELSVVLDHIAGGKPC